MPPQPAVRDLQKLITQYSSAFDPEKKIIDTQIQQNDQSGAAQEAGLAAKQKTAFNNIEQTAQNKGMFFSGFSPNEQANYTADTYLPELARLQSAIATTRGNLLGKKAEYDTAARTSAMGAQEQDRKVLADWNQMTAQQQFQASQAEKDRAFQAQQNQLKINAEAANTAASRSAATQDAPIAERVRAMLDASKGADGKVSPSTWRQVAAYAADNGLKFGGGSGFANKYWQYANENNWQDYQKGYDKYL